MLKVIQNKSIRNKAVNFLKNARHERCNSTKPDVVSSADVVVIGGGIVGCNTLYQLSKRGVNAVLLERAKLTSGTTWHTGGIVWSLRTNDLQENLLRDSKAVFKELEEKTGEHIGWTQSGGLFISRSPIRTQEYLRIHSLSKAMGIPSEVLNPKEAQKLFPLLDPAVFEMALYSPQDGALDPPTVCNALVKLAAKNGAKVYEECPVVDIHYSDNVLGHREVTGVHTDSGFIKTKCVVNCGGAWGPRIARFAGIPTLPLIPIKHAYVVSEAMPEVRNSPHVKDSDANLYIKVQGEVLAFGGYERDPHMLDQVPDNFQFQLYELDWNSFGVHMASATSLIPKLSKTGIKSTVCGPESFTPDHKPLMGEDPNIFGLYHNVGYNSAGMMFSAGTSVQMAEWIIHGRPQYHMFEYDIRRFSPSQLARSHWVRERCHEAYVCNFNVYFHYDEPLAGRDVSHDALHQEMVDDGAVMQTRGGWERPAFFLPGEKIRVQQYDWGGTNDHPHNLDKRYEDILRGDFTFGFSKHHDLIGYEALACRNSAALFNMSYNGKFYLTGPDAQRTAELAFTADLAKNDDRVGYSLMLNENGGVEADVWVSVLDGDGDRRLHEPSFKGRGYYVVTAGFNTNHTLAHIRRIINKHNLEADLTDVSKQLCVLSVQGPDSRKILQRFTNAELSNDAFPINSHRSIELSSAPSTSDGKRYTCRALRVNWGGELGWELHIPSSHSIQVYRQLKSVKGLRNAGWRALNSLCAEKGYHLWNADLRSDDNPIEANLGFTCRKNGDYIGNEHVTKAKQNGVTKKYAYFTLEDKVALYGEEAIYRNGKPVGFLRRGDYGYFLDKPIGVGYVSNNGTVITNDFLKDGSYEIEVLGKKYKAVYHKEPPFDPSGQRLLGNY